MFPCPEEVLRQSNGLRAQMLERSRQKDDLAQRVPEKMDFEEMFGGEARGSLSSALGYHMSRSGPPAQPESVLHLICGVCYWLASVHVNFSALSSF